MAYVVRVYAKLQIGVATVILAYKENDQGYQNRIVRVLEFGCKTVPVEGVSCGGTEATFGPKTETWRLYITQLPEVREGALKRTTF